MRDMARRYPPMPPLSHWLMRAIVVELMFVFSSISRYDSPEASMRATAKRFVISSISCSVQRSRIKDRISLRVASERRASQSASYDAFIHGAGREMRSAELFAVVRVMLRLYHFSVIKSISSDWYFVRNRRREMATAFELGLHLIRLPDCEWRRGVVSESVSISKRNSGAILTT